MTSPPLLASLAAQEVLDGGEELPRYPVLQVLDQLGFELGR